MGGFWCDCPVPGGGCRRCGGRPAGAGWYNLGAAREGFIPGRCFQKAVERPMIVIVDYKMGNLDSVVRALTRVGAEARVSADPAEVEIGRASCRERV